MAKEVMHQQFYYELLNKIKSGELKNGEKIPAERTLCELYNISRTTVREALRNLEIEGYMVRKQGSGSFVQIKPLNQNLAKLYTLRDLFAQQNIKHDVKLIDFTILPCSDDTSKRLKIPQGDEVIKIVRVFSAADVPYTIEYTHLPRSIFPEITKEMIIEDGLYNTLERYGKKPTSAEETLRAVSINNEQKKLLDLSKKVLAIETKRVTCSDNEVIEYTQNTIRNDYFIYTVKLK